MTFLHKTSSLLLQITAVLFVVFFHPIVFATAFPLPASENALLGEIQYAQVTRESPATIAERYNLGLNAIVNANPGSTERVVYNATGSVKLATQFLLPPVTRKGIVINLPEMRMYYFPENSNQMMTFPVGIGKIGKTIPIRNTIIARKKVNPVWIPPADIRQYNEDQGIHLPTVMAAGPDNPLGPYAIYLGIPTYLIHSTIFPESIGRRASFGCIRMNESDIKEFFPLVTAGTPVTILNMPNKIAWNGDQLYLEAHPPLEEHADTADIHQLINTIANSLPHHDITLVNWQLVAYLTEQPDGVPHEIGIKLAPSSH
ncbi:MAG: L,D-transpeptidase family protein [Gammaproteobacteria bacterium]|nr:L,D-transpeptidase family protein [Gammaproteobacteria bacterium]